MIIIVNGESYNFDTEMTIIDLLKEFKLDNKPIVVEHNREIVIKDDYSDIEIADGDSFELITFVGGG